MILEIWDIFEADQGPPHLNPLPQGERRFKGDPLRERRESVLGKPSHPMGDGKYREIPSPTMGDKKYQRDSLAPLGGRGPG
jgi:hypothetical protein